MTSIFKCWPGVVTLGKVFPSMSCAALHHDMAQHQAAVARQIDVNDLDVGIDISDVILPRQFVTNPAVAARIMDRIDPDAGGFLRIVVMEDGSSSIAHHGSLSFWP
jgi:hypothetical protein